MTKRRVIACMVALVAAAGAVAPGATGGGKPVIERIAVDEVFADDFLTDACGVPVSTRALGHVIVRTFPGPTGTVELQTLNVALTASAGGNTYRFRDVGADQVQVKRDGSAILMIIGQIPFGFTGVTKINLVTGEVVHEPHHGLEGRVEEACAALTA